MNMVRGARLALIADAFPGLLDWPSLWGLDAREEVLLQGMAKVTRLRREVDQAQAIRVGMATEKDYLKVMSATNKEIIRTSTGQTKEDEYAQNRLALRGLFGVKGK